MEQQNTESVVLPVGAANTSLKAQIGQKEATYNFIMEVSRKTGVSVQAMKENSTPEAKSARKEVAKALKSAIEAGVISLKVNKEGAKLSAYCSGLVLNWLKKDPRFNS